jgi:hypothetical protein
VPAVRDFIATGEALVRRADQSGRAGALQVQRLRGLQRAFGNRLRMTAPPMQ